MSEVSKRAQLAGRFGICAPLLGGPIALLSLSFGSLVSAPIWAQMLAALATLGLLVGSVLSWKGNGRAWAPQLFGLLACVVLALPSLAGAPAIALMAGVSSLWIASRLVETPSLGRHRRDLAIVCFGVWLAWALLGRDQATVSLLATIWAVALGCLVSLAGSPARRPRRLRIDRIGVVTVALLAVLTLVGLGQLALGLAAVLALLGARTGPDPLPRVRPRGVFDLVLDHPERLFVGTFLFLCSVGAVLLALPVSTEDGVSIGVVDAIFTATSAVCVTGLAVVDTPSTFSGFGEGVLLVLIQIGGLGIMAFSTVILAAIGRRMSMAHEGAVASLMGTSARGQLATVARRILVVTVSLECLGALSLALAFYSAGDSAGVAVWRGVFTSVSAFCNAGFALQSDSLVAFQSSPWVLHTTAILIIAGGLSPLVIVSAPRAFRRGGAVSATVRICLWTSIALLLLSFVVMLSLEWNDSLASMSISDKIGNAWFQAVTLRTAGFNSVDLTQWHSATLSLSLPIMFIGGCPGGTAGGIKTTTLFVILIFIVHALRGRHAPTVFGRAISPRSITRAMSIAMIAFFFLFFAVVALQLTQAIGDRDIVFEVVSAIGTVGLSLGGTAQLDGVGKAIIVACMFAGRVGAITFLSVFKEKAQGTVHERPVEDIQLS